MLEFSLLQVLMVPGLLSLVSILWKFYKRLRFFRGFLCGSAGKESTCNARDLGSIPELGRSSGEREGYPLPYSGLKNSLNCIVHGVSKNWTPLSDFHFTFS